MLSRMAENDFREVIGERIEKVCTPLGVEVACAFQEITDAPIQVEDRPGVEASFRKLIEAGVYKADLYSDL